MLRRLTGFAFSLLGCSCGVAQADGQISKVVIFEQCWVHKNDCEVKPATAALNGAVWLKNRVLFQTLDPVRWNHCLQLNAPSICLVFSEKDVDRINHDMRIYLRKNVAIVVNGVVVASSIYSGPIKNPLVIDNIDEAILTLKVRRE